ncbi:MAG: hypothetical protein HY360_00720, partial [Verrucomicrobia bacterium]|nr:hypothetical protein [Verrucomicrobiota bacterium]
MASARVRPLEAISSRFEPLSIAGHLNAATLNGEKVDRASLPGLRHDEVAAATQAGASTPGKIATVAGVPFQFPAASAKGDDHIDVGTSWWGAYGGDGIVDLPLKLEKIMVERRPKVIYGNDLVEAKTDDVLLGDLNAEYARAADQTGGATGRFSKEAQHGRLRARGVDFRKRCTLRNMEHQGSAQAQWVKAGRLR